MLSKSEAFGLPGARMVFVRLGEFLLALARCHSKSSTRESQRALSKPEALGQPGIYMMIVRLVEFLLALSRCHSKSSTSLCALENALSDFSEKSSASPHNPPATVPEASGRA